MEENLLKVFKLVDILNEKQDKVYAQIYYEASNSKKLEISIRSKEDYKFIERCEVHLTKNNLIKWENIIELLESYVEGVSNE